MKNKHIQSARQHILAVLQNNQHITRTEPKIKMHTIISDVDLSKGTAKIIGNNRTMDVHVMMNEIGLVFIEITDIAFHTYVVYNTKTLDMEKDDGQFPTIQSRNALLFNGVGISSQLAGLCVAVSQ